MNLADLPLPMLQGLITLETARQNKLMQQQRDAQQGKGERTPTKSKPATNTVDGSKQPKATDVKTQTRGKRSK